jgi:hypothetical protein
LADRLFEAGIRGGQAGSGEQKDGLFKYDRNRMTAIFDPDARAYVPLSDPRFAKAAEWLGEPPAGHRPWSVLAKDRGKAAALAGYLAGLGRAGTEGAKLARAFLDHSRRVSAGLVASGVAASPEDVKTVLMDGFYHLYGPSDWTS